MYESITFMIRKLFSNLVFVSVSVFIALFGVEFVLEFLVWREQAQTAASSKPSIYTYSLTSGDGKPLSHRLGDLKLALHPAYLYGNLPNQRNARFSINNLGYRGAQDIDLEAVSSGSTRTIVLMGGSTAFSTGVSADEHSLQEQLQTRLDDVNVVNTATLGHFSGQELVRTILEVVDLSPEIIVSVGGWNDFAFQINRPIPSWGLGLGGYQQLEERLRTNFLISEPNYVWRILNASKLVLFPELTKRVLALYSSKPVSGQTRAATSEDIAKSYASNMIKIAKIAEAFGAKFLAVIQPDQRVVNVEPANRNWEANAYDEFRRSAKAILSANGVNALDLNSFLGVFTDDMFLDAIHLNDEGNAAMAAVLEDRLQEILDDRG